MIQIIISEKISDNDTFESVILESVHHLAQKIHCALWALPLHIETSLGTDYFLTLTRTLNVSIILLIHE